MICIDCRSVVEHPTGLLSYQALLARHLPALAPHCHFQFLRHLDASGRLTFHPNAHELFVPGDPESSLAPLTLARNLEHGGINLFHSTGGLFPPGLRAPVVTTIHDLLWLTSPRWVRPSGLRGRIVANLCGHYVREALLRSARIIVPSQATRRAIDELAPSIAEHVVVIPHGVGPQFKPLDPSQPDEADRVRERCSRLLGGAPRFIVDVGRAAIYRNHAGLLRAFVSAFKQDQDIHLAFVQAMGEHTKEISKLATRLGVGSRVHILSGMSSRDLVTLYQGAICLCHPTLHEAFGTVVAEAFACGCPVITSTRAAVGEIAEGAAQLINPEHDDEVAAAMRRIAYEPGVAERLRERGLQRATELSAQHMAEQTFAVYQAVLEECRGRNRVARKPVATLRPASAPAR